jgi:HNH endonuclease
MAGVYSTCQICGTSMWPRSNGRGKPRQRFCSMVCVGQFHRTRRSLAQRFWEKVASSSDGHWYWMGDRRRDGYGQLKRHRRAHRVGWELIYGPIPQGQWVLHRCDTPPCVRPDHLFLGNHAANTTDAVAKGRMGGPAWIGVENGRAKLTDAQVRTIRRATGPRGLCRRLAAKYGVTNALISHIRTHRIWRHLP